MPCMPRRKLISPRWPLKWPIMWSWMPWPMVSGPLRASRSILEVGVRDRVEVLVGLLPDGLLVLAEGVHVLDDEALGVFV